MCVHCKNLQHRCCFWWRCLWCCNAGTGSLNEGAAMAKSWSALAAPSFAYPTYPYSGVAFYSFALSPFASSASADPCLHLLLLSAGAGAPACSCCCWCMAASGTESAACSSNAKCRLLVSICRALFFGHWPGIFKLTGAQIFFQGIQWSNSLLSCSQIPLDLWSQVKYSLKVCQILPYHV
jgi:hypothetical protein